MTRWPSASPQDGSPALRSLPNVILTPHIGGATRETIVRQSKTVVEDLERFLRGARPRNIANPQALKVARGR